MSKSSKKQLKRELTAVDVKQKKQSTLEDLSFQFNINRKKEASKPAKAIVINRITETTNEDRVSP
jgi:hypothetical protein